MKRSNRASPLLLVGATKADSKKLSSKSTQPAVSVVGRKTVPFNMSSPSSSTPSVSTLTTTSMPLATPKKRSVRIIKDVDDSELIIEDVDEVVVQKSVADKEKTDVEVDNEESKENLDEYEADFIDDEAVEDNDSVLEEISSNSDDEDIVDKSSSTTRHKRTRKDSITLPDAESKRVTKRPKLSNEKSSTSAAPKKKKSKHRNHEVKIWVRLTERGEPISVKVPERCMVEDVKDIIVEMIKRRWPKEPIYPSFEYFLKYRGRTGWIFMKANDPIKEPGTEYLLVK